MTSDFKLLSLQDLNARIKQSAFLERATRRLKSSGIAGQRGIAFRNQTNLINAQAELLRRNITNEGIESLGLTQTRALLKIVDPAKTERIGLLEKRISDIGIERRFKPKTTENLLTSLKIPFAKESEIERIQQLNRQIFNLESQQKFGFFNKALNRNVGGATKNSVIILQRTKFGLNMLLRDIRVRTGNKPLDDLGVWVCRASRLSLFYRLVSNS